MRCLRKFDLFRLITGCTYAPAAEAQKRRTFSHDAVLMSLSLSFFVSENVEVIRAEMFAFAFDQALFEFA